VTLIATVLPCEIPDNPSQTVEPAPFIYERPGLPQAPSSWNLPLTNSPFPSNQNGVALRLQPQSRKNYGSS
jgi:hypothetical protein